MLHIRDSYRLPGTVKALKWLILLCVLSFWTNGRTIDQSLVWQVLGFVPAQFGNPDVYASAYADLLQTRPPGLVTVITSCFIHADFFHLFFNLVFLWIFGANVERQMGALKLLIFFFTCAAVGTFCHTLIDPSSEKVLIGNSGAVSGMLGAYFALFPDHDLRITIGTPRSKFFRDVLLPYKVLLVFWIVPQLLYSLMPMPGTVDSTAYMAHFGGFAAGFLLAGGNILKLSRGKRRFKVFPGGKAG